MSLIVKVVKFDELPTQDIKDLFWDRYNEQQYYNYLLIYHDDVLVYSESDRMEPEDATFTRDLSWIAEQIQKAYEFGKQEGIKLEFGE